MNSVDVSIIIPIYNAAVYLEKTLQSVLKQTYKNIEIICVNDASTDKTIDILNKYAEEDKRIHIINEEINVGTSKARKDGVLCSQGRYIVFVDADDILMPNACEKIVSFGKTQGFDIIQYDVNVIGHNGIRESSVEEMRRYIKPLIGLYEMREIQELCFQNASLAHNLWGKAFNGSVCRQAFTYVDNERMLMAEDLYAYFLITVFSKTYIGISDKLYQYNYGLGITGENQEFYKTFEVYCSQSLVIENCRNFISKIGMCEEYCEIQEGIRKNLINTCIKFLVKNKVKIAEVNTAYIENILKKYWGIEEMAYICLELVKQCQGHEETIKKKGWLFPYRKIRKDSHIVLYGAGDVGQDFYKQLKDTGYCDIILWVDKAYEKYREYGLNVESPYKIQLCDFDYILIAMSNTAVKNQIKNELLNIGINNDKIV